jgi:hypothetical protein
MRPGRGGPDHDAGELAVRVRHLGVAVRETFAGEECACDHRSDEPHEEGCPAVDGHDDGLLANDVFIVEGRQERYGSKRAWEVCG